MRQLITKYQPPGVINKPGEIFVDETTGQIKIGNGSASNGVDVKPLSNAQITAGASGVVGSTSSGGLVLPDGTIVGNTVASIPAQFGVPITISSATVLAAADHDGALLMCTGNPLLTINNGLGSKFGIGIYGAFTYNGAASITDKRVAGAANPSAALVHTAVADTYELHGTKA